MLHHLLCRATPLTCGNTSPEWNRTEAQITGPGKTYSWESSWTFSLL